MIILSNGAGDLLLPEPPSLTWQPVDPAGWYAAEADNFTANIDTNRRKVLVFMSSDHSGKDLITAADLVGSIGLPFPITELELGIGTLHGEVYGWSISADDDDIWTFRADF